LSTPQSSLHSAFAVLDSGRELRTARAEVETKAPERTSALPRSEREHCDVVDIIPAIVWSALPDGSNVYVNSRFVEYSGMSAEQLAGSGWHAATHPDDLQRHERKWLACVRTCEVFEDEVRFRRADGQYRWHLQRGVPLRNQDENILKSYGVLTDIEDRKRAEEKIQEQEIELRQILDLAPQLIAVYGPNQERLYANRNALEYLGMSLDEWLQTPSGADVHPDDVEKLWAFEDRGSSSYDLEVRKGDGSFRF
jgi:PAS domain S-box-containing protein